MRQPISDNFVLTRHVLTPKDCDPIVFYVLYMHLMPCGPVREKTANEHKAVPVFFQSRFFVKRNGVKPNQGLTVYNNSLSPMEEPIPPAAELFFDDPHKVAANHRLHPFDLSSRFKRITGYEREGQFHPLPGYVIPETTTVEVRKRIDYQLDRVVVRDYPLRPGDVLGFSGRDGAVKDDTTVHMELFIKDETSYTALQTYTDRQQAALELPDDALLNLKGLITGKTITDAICHGNTLRDLFPNLSKILEVGYPGTRLRKMRMSRLMLNPDKHPATLDKLRRLVVKTKSEWHTVKGEYDCLKLNKGGTYSDEKYSAYLELFQEKMDFWHLLKDDNGKAFPDECYFFHPIKFIEHLKLISKEDEIIFVPNCSKLGEEMFLVLKPQESDEIRKEEQELGKKIEKLQEANESQNEGEIKKAKEQLAKALTSGATGGDFDNLTEIRRLSGKKATYVRSDKIKNHWRKYALNKDDRDKSFKTKNGNLDRKKILDKFTEMKGKVSKEWNIAGDSLAGHENEFGKYIDGLNKSLTYSMQKNRGKDPKDVNFDITASAQLLRYYANAGFEGEVDFKKMKFGLKANANAAIALAEGKIASEAYWPNQAGFEMKFELRSKKTGMPVKFNFGKVRAMLELSGAGFVGASAVGSIYVEIGKPEGKEHLAFRGVNKVNKPGKKVEPDKRTATGQLFAGASLEGQVTGKCQWDNPEKRNADGTPDWCDFVSIGYGIKGAAGFGGEVEFDVKYEDGKFVFRARAGLVIGLGGGGGIMGAVDAGKIMEFIQFVYHQVKNNDFSFVDAIETRAFKAITQLQVWAMETGKEIGEFVEDTAEAIEKSVNNAVKTVKEIEVWWDLRRESIEDARDLSNRILNQPEILKFTLPEAKGIMLHTLTKTHNEITERYKNNKGVLVLSRITGVDEAQLELQERAIIKILEHVQSIGDYQKVCKRISPNATEIDYHTGHKKIYDILDGYELNQLRAMRHKWILDLINKNQITNWKEGGEKVFNRTTRKNSPVEIMELV